MRHDRRDGAYKTSCFALQSHTPHRDHRGPERDFSLALWVMALSAMTSFLARTGTGVVILMAGSTSGAFETILETIGAFVLGLLAAIGAILGALSGSLLE